MYGTVVRDTYRKTEAQSMAAALERLCSPKDRIGWASNGVYCFWDVLTDEVLYVGLARDIPTRFRQHNGLLACPEKGCKVREIERHFAVREQLGYAILVQSPLAQVSGARTAKHLVGGKEDSDYQDLVEHGESNIIRVEGALIEAHNRATGSLPSWNKIHGSWIGRSQVKDDTIALLWLLTVGDGPLVARHTIRALASDAELFMLESDLHGARSMWLLHESMGWHEAIDVVGRFVPWPPKRVEHLKDYCGLPDTP